ncbi:MAG: hypothetical protein COX81_03395 [Candidatus Magasanikbacteria bacterium CG_4_10_14_0_2_um_filter_37_12]|uniref:Iron transporter n=1 Tax=Candidatus Magasanikbacteria bacterium CG_4_10_14_0_2_um_filter_37_12 TaxID=1974637 RepID=A0A2M7V733_9BACT|nr:MAG: hypothetical protein COX81_03395 [Candidatus Magasanikbacteria bacterium CG_4_10_14_0_2_um_filter_37_12]
MHVPNNKNYIHHRLPGIGATIRELVFGMEDGMVSTMGAITGIAVGSNEPKIVILSGAVIIAVESISMGLGSYLSNKSEQEVNQNILSEEREEISNYPEEEKKEMFGLFVTDGWSKNMAQKMTEEVSKDKKLMLREMAYRELKVHTEHANSPWKNGLVMLFSYIFGGAIPLLPYLFSTDLGVVVPISISITLVALFILGSITTRYSKRKWWKAGLEMFLLATFAAVVGFGIGSLVG